jgi:hypothetical protein
LECEIFQTKALRKSKHIFYVPESFLSSNTLQFVIRCGKCGKTRQATNYGIIGRIRFAWCITKPTKAHPEYVIFLLFYDNNRYTNAHQSCVIVCAFPVLLRSSWSSVTWYLPQKQNFRKDVAERSQSSILCYDTFLCHFCGFQSNQIRVNERPGTVSSCVLCFILSQCDL